MFASVARHSEPINVIDYGKKSKWQAAMKMHLVRKTLLCDEILGRLKETGPCLRLGGCTAVNSSRLKTIF